MIHCAIIVSVNDCLFVLLRGSINGKASAAYI